MASYINEESKAIYKKVLSKIKKLFNNAIVELTKYFTAIHDDDD